MNLAVGFAVLVAVAFLESVSGQEESKYCEFVGGTCQSIDQMDNCLESSGIFKKDSFSCTETNKGCCIPPGCFFGSKALSNGAIVKQGECRKLQCKGGIMVVDDKECISLLKGKCDEVKGKMLYELQEETPNNRNQKCLIIKSDGTERKNWGAAEENCRSIDGEWQGQLASFEGIEDVGNLLKEYPHSISFWIGGSDTAKQGSWTWLNGKPIISSRIDGDCLTAAIDQSNTKGLRLKDEPCSTVRGYICEIVEAPKTCACNYNKYGCTLAEPTAPGYACHCEEKEETGKETRCEGTVVRCNDPDSVACKTSGTSFEHCMQGVRKRVRGNCCGYFTAKENYCY